MTKKILVPSGIGDFSWTWSKLVTTDDKFDIDYVGGTPDRMMAYLGILPKERIVKFKSNPNYTTKWDEKHMLAGYPRQGHPEIVNIKAYGELNGIERKFIECNSLLEAGGKLETWLSDEIPGIDYHYKINGTVKNCRRNNYFIVNFSSYGTKKAWGYYDVKDSVEIVKFIIDRTGFIPMFIGGYYDDYTIDICNEIVKEDLPAINLVGKTPNLIEVVALLQQSQFYFGACSGLMAIANVLYTPAIVYYPPFDVPPGRKLSGTWHDPEVLHLGLFWEGKDKDKPILDRAFTRITKEAKN